MSPSDYVAERHIGLGVQRIRRISGKPAAAIVALLVLAAGISIARKTSVRPEPSRVDLTLSPITENLVALKWNRNLPAITDATSAALRISDGGRDREILLDRTQLANGFMTYRAASDDVTFRLKVRRRGGAEVLGSIRYIMAAPVPSGSRPREAPVPELAPAALTNAQETSVGRKRISATGVADRRSVRDGVARFFVKTPGARITIRPADGTDEPETTVTSESIRVASGMWSYHASAPGFLPESGRFLVNTAGPADIFIRLRAVDTDGR